MGGKNSFRSPTLSQTKLGSELVRSQTEMTHTHTNSVAHESHRSGPFTQPAGECDFNEPVLNGH